MKTLSTLFLLTALLVSGARSQSVIHPWHVVDRGGGRSAAGGITLQSSIGQPAVAAMSAGGTNLESGYIPGLRVFSGSTATLTYAVENGWNLLSLPYIVSDYHVPALYPTAISPAFEFRDGYVTDSLLHNSSGYWLKFGGAGAIPLAGTTIQQESVSVATGWNMIGTPSYPVVLTDIVAVGTTVTSHYFGYANLSGYFTEDTLEPGYGYWVKTSSAGKLFLKTGSVMNAPKNIPQTSTKTKVIRTLAGVKSMEGVSQMTITDASGRSATLYFSSTRKDIDASKYELPPLPPAGMMDVRFATNRAYESAAPQEVRSIPLLISSATYPITAQWSLSSGSTGVDLIVKGKPIDMRASQQIQISDPESPVRLRLQPADAVLLPKVFALYQNYPNPFNPTTHIKYDLPRDAHVVLKIYDAIGQEIRTLKDEVENAGFKSTVWNATNGAGASVASGVYFYRIEATSVADPGKPFVDIKKMMVVK